MAAVLTGTPVQVTWAAGANPAGQSITIPSDATAVYMFWAYDGVDANGHGLASATLNSASPDQTFEIPTAAGFFPATGVAVWYNPSTGSQTLDPAWDTAPVEGPVTIVAFVKDGDTTAWRDADADQATSSTAVTVTLTTVSGDLVLKFDQRYDPAENPPSLSAGWTNGLTGGNVDEGCRLSYISATGTTQVCNSENEEYSSIVAISIPAAPTGYTLACNGGSFTLTGAAAALKADRKIAAAGGTYALTGADATLTYGAGNDYTLTAEGGSFTLTGAAAGLAHGYRLSAEGGSYTLTGADALRDFSMVAAAGSYTLTGGSATLVRGYTLTASGGSFALTGADAALKADRNIAAAGGSYTLTGADATLTYEPAGAYTLTAEGGSFALTGTDAALIADRVIAASGGVFTLTGADAALRADRSLSAEGGSYTLTGSDVTLTYDEANPVMPADGGAYVVTGGDATLTYRPVDLSNPGGWPLPHRKKKRRIKEEDEEPPQTAIAEAIQKAEKKTGVKVESIARKLTEQATRQLAQEVAAQVAQERSRTIEYQQQEEELAMLLISLMKRPAKRGLSSIS